MLFATCVHKDHLNKVYRSINFQNLVNTLNAVNILAVKYEIKDVLIVNKARTDMKLDNGSVKYTAPLKRIRRYFLD